ncbi:transcriptional regulator [Haloimpatiens sp. FM7315]|uniref:helix-turn-helix transcriptional regulator n=1 Tax=Haloimpatiens sp. FM7315 TaxID=3298609 RepID=UPI0035A34EF8
MSNLNKLEKYIPLVKFIGDVLGEDSEVVLHDVTNPENSIVTIVNGEVSGRKEKGPLTDLALKILKDKTYKNKEFICNYRGNSKGNRVFKSSSYFIKDEGNIIGMICINIDVTSMIKARDILNSLINIDEEISDEKSSTQNNTLLFEHLDENIDEVIDSIISGVLKEYPVEPERMSAEEKLEIVKKLNEKGIFLLKGGVSEVAKNLRTSETTIYRYINKIK